MSDGAWLGELLAVMHGDGGHYQSEHGVEKATKDAIKLHYRMITRIDELETALATAVDQFTRCHHNPIVADLNKQLAAERESHATTLVALGKVWQK